MAIQDPVRVGKSVGGDAYLVLERADIERGELNGPAQIQHANGDKSEVLPLQQFYKFGVWYPVEGDEREPGATA